MNDCVNAEYRDQLPALLHNRLGAAERDALVAHIAGCVDCDEELALLRTLQGMFADATPRVSTASIVSALPAPPLIAQSLPAGVLPFRQRVARRIDWRVAAAIGVLAVGGSSFALARRAEPGAAATASRAVAVAGPTVVPAAPTVTDSQAMTVATAAVPVAAAATPVRVASGPATTNVSDAELSMTGRLDDLSAEQLQTLLGEIDNLQATPIAEPEPEIVPVTLTSDGGPSGA